MKHWGYLHGFYCNKFCHILCLFCSGSVFKNEFSQQVSGSNDDTEPFKACYSSYTVCVFKIDKHLWSICGTFVTVLLETKVWKVCGNAALEDIKKLWKIHK